jgi:DNA-binding LacI/PurR family transcriptional regulator
MSGIADVARLAAVSKSTASRALSGSGYVSPATRSKVERAAAVLGFVASSNAASLVTGKTRNVGVVTPFVNRWFFGAVIEGIEAALVEAGYDLTLYHLSEDPDARRRVFDYFLVRKRVDAVVAVGITLSPVELASLRTLDKPIIVIGAPADGITTLGIDDGESSRRITEHLIGLGHTRIVHIGSDGRDRRGPSMQATRYSGFRFALAAAGIPRGDDFRESHFTIRGGYEIARDLLADPATRPTAIAAASDDIAIGVIIAARELGIAIPAELSVIGIDDHELSELFGLTTLRQAPADQGRLAVELIMTALESGGEALAHSPHAVDVEFVDRGSTAAPAG